MTGGRHVPVHYLRANHAEWTPAHVVTFDTESATVETGDREVEVLRLWCARFEDRRPIKGKDAACYDANGDTAAELADEIEGFSKGRRTVWVFAHNLSFDLVLTRVPLVLAARGWTITDAAVGGKSPWLRMRNKDRRLCLVDSFSWLPRSAADLAPMVGMRKPPLPKADDARGVWVRRCEADVAIQHAAITQLMDWWDRGQLGRWTISGAGCGWNAMRHTPTPQKITIDPDPDGVAFDRRAIHGGRRGVWRVGEQAAGPFLELDFAAAYPMIAATMPLPVGRKRRFDHLPIDNRYIGSERWGIIAEVEVETDVPRWPVKVKRRSWYPTGRFRTVLAGPEIAEAARLGCLRAIGAGYVHQLGYAIENWAHWCLAVQRGEHPDAPAVAQVAAKAWGRSVIGKFAAHAYEKTELGPSPIETWGYEEGYDHDSKARGGIVDIAGRRWWVAAAGEGENAYPAVLAWVESAVRVRLSRAIEALGSGALVQADTDGLIASARLVGTAAARGHLRAPAGLPTPARVRWVLDCIDPIVAPLTLRIKRQATHVHIIGPQHLKVDDQRRLAGIPGKAEETAPGEFAAHLWPKLQWQMRHGDPRGYVRPRITPKLKASYVAGWVTDANRVVPAAAQIDADGRTRLLAWHNTPGRPLGAQLAGWQHPELDGLW